MPVSNVTTNDTFFEWLTKTNQLIVEYNQTNTIAQSAFESANSVSFTAANIASNVLSTNAVYLGAIANTIISANLTSITDAVVANTLLNATLSNNANASANTRATTLVTSASYSSNLANLIIAEGSLTASILANTDLTTQIYTNANTVANTQATTIVVGTAYTSNLANILVAGGALANSIVANSLIRGEIANNANAVAEAFNANSNLGLAWNRANSSLANTSSYTLVIDDLIITGNVTLSGANAVLNLL